MRLFMKSMIKSALLIAVMGMTLAGCGTSLSPNYYTSESAGQANRVVAGTIVSSRIVNVSNGTNAIGTVAGGAAGAIAAGSLIGQGNGSLLAGIGGALVGGYLGNRAENALSKQQGIEYIIKTTSGGMVSVVQDQSVVFARGQHVLVEYGDRARVIADPSYQ